MTPQTEDAYQLMHEGAVALAQVEAAGMRVDTAYLDRTIRETARRIGELRDAIYTSDVWSRWRRKYGSDANLGSKPQLGDILFNEMGFTSKERTATGKYKTDVEALGGIDHPFVRDYGDLAKLDKLHGTYLLGLQREVVNGYVHPFFHLHTVVTYRSSSSDPNFQNIPIRDPVIGKLIREAFIPRDRHLIIENDFKGIEVAASWPYHQDPRWLGYLEDPSTDMHRDAAMKLFMVDDPKKISKEARHTGKDGFVFPTFYGAWYIKCAPDIWANMEARKLAVDGVPMREHLRKHGIMELGDCDPNREPREGTYEKHVREFERWYWFTQYPVYSQWKKDWYADYQRTGGFSSLTGFYYEGVFDRNQVLNYTIQGTAFHWLLWVLTRLVSWLKKNKMRSRVVGQIHDSILGDVHEDEKDVYLAKVKELVTVGLPRYWDWICVPLTVEAEITDVNGNWFKKRSVPI